MDDTIIELLQKISKTRDRLHEEALEAGFATPLATDELESLSQMFQKRIKMGDDPQKATYMTFLESMALSRADARVEWLIINTLIAVILKHSRELPLALIAQELSQLKMPLKVE